MLHVHSTNNLFVLGSRISKQAFECNLNSFYSSRKYHSLFKKRLRPPSTVLTTSSPHFGHSLFTGTSSSRFQTIEPPSSLAIKLKFHQATSIVHSPAFASGFHSSASVGTRSSEVVTAANPPDPAPSSSPETTKTTKRENIYTFPNLITCTRIFLCPLLAYSIIHDYHLLSSITLLYCGVSDWLDGLLARKYPKQMASVLGTILDPAADKILMTTLVFSLAWKQSLPLPLAVLIIGRDALLGVSAFYFRYQSLPAPKTFKRFWDFSLPSAEVKPTQLSKYNTFLQLSLVGLTTIDPMIPLDLSTPLTMLQWTVAFTTLTSGISYVFSKDAIRYIK
ncbi:uncharacterized protein MELLADRAFT_71819 [Melampsora larici-populina 98AG31]|uniref:CDP-alcohol phosphatidyltransferase n=1 Tax=Melampsora larici-populina (strain 98AG31 / pathotype 3-4-7) TaxID=747676 RepID=F4RLF8_MELLP|nr:uncharacterized protein MELLADRAFT_71819 [Melampsora larici-populina 98AG31]EGG07002.1 hypothetical protein MELLADRAFT_71819 [Melampsora larici-populina 98AG31]